MPYFGAKALILLLPMFLALKLLVEPFPLYCSKKGLRRTCTSTLSGALPFFPFPRIGGFLLIAESAVAMVVKEAELYGPADGDMGSSGIDWSSMRSCG